MATLKLVGEISWAHTEDTAGAEVDRALLRNGNELVIECRYENSSYQLLLKRSSGTDVFAGSGEARKGKEKWSVQASGTLYSSGERHLFFGKWKELGVPNLWVVEFEQVEKFPDEIAGR